MTDTSIENITNPESFRQMLAEVQGSPQESDSVEPSEDQESQGETPDVPTTQEDMETEPKNEGQNQDDEDDEDGYELHKNENGAFVSLGAMKRKSQANKALKEQLNKQREDYIALKTQYDAIQEAIKEFIPAKNQDFQSSNDDFEPLDSEADQRYKKEINTLRQAQEETKHALEYQQMSMGISQMEQQFSVTVPDYADAVNFLANKQIEEAAVFFGKSKDQVHDAAKAALSHIVHISYTQGRNPSEVIYNLAKAKGFTAKKTASPQKAESDIDAINKNMKRSASINGIPSSSAPSSNGAYQITNEKWQGLLNEKNGVDKDAFHKELERLKKLSS